MAKGIFEKAEADKIAVDYNPRKFPSVITPTASKFVAHNTEGVSSFRIDKLVAQQTGVAELERLSIEEKVEREALARMKDIQEAAYREAYRLGLDEGREKAFQEKTAELEEKFAHFETLLGSIERLKQELITFNETQIVHLIFYMAKRLLMSEVTERPELIIDVLKQAVEAAQSDENVTIRLSPSDFAFVQSIKDTLGKDFDSIKRAKVESSEDVQTGGCIVETNYGDVNASLEQRVKKLWDAVAEKLPRIKPVIGA
jgi:flagellar assembly protein FliH